ncbi:hypothetical protein ABMA27_000353 [Loxostege sticticalis]|uniref:Regulatory protein zeste n=1 Tax=Loxostege sticticalis TaxID=481309 RepID=A0ABR3IN51_LOXSC
MSRRVSMIQLNHLWEFLSNHRDIVIGYNKSLTARDHSKSMWERVATNLNSYWVDLKSQIKRNNRLINDARRGTGGGPAADLELAKIEIKFLQILGDDYGFGLPGLQVDPLDHTGTQTTLAAETGGSEVQVQVQAGPPLELSEHGAISVPRTGIPATLPRQRPQGLRRRQRPRLNSSVELRQRLIRSCESRHQTELITIQTTFRGPK